MLKSLGILVFLLAYVAYSEGQKSYQNYKLYSCYFQTAKQVDALRTLDDYGLIDFWTGPNANISSDVMVGPEAQRIFEDILNEQKVPFEVIINNIQKNIDEERVANEKARLQAIARNKALGITKAAPLDDYKRYDEIIAWVRTVVADNPSFATLNNIGNSYEGRTMYALKLGFPGTGKQNIVIDACMHAREWLACSTWIYFVNQLITEQATDSSIRALLQKYDFWLIPVANPDGYEFTRQDRLWRKTRHPNPGSTCMGVDPNRNFAASWGSTGASGSPCSETYYGPYPHSAEEVENLAALLVQLRPRFYVNIHTYSCMWLIPYGYTSVRPPTYNEIMRVSTAGALALAAVHGTVYSVGTIWEVIYPASGSSVDYAFDSASTPYSQTLELRSCPGQSGGFVQPPSQIIPTGQETYAGLIAAIKAMP